MELSQPPGSFWRRVALHVTLRRSPPRERRAKRLIVLLPDQHQQLRHCYDQREACTLIPGHIQVYKFGRGRTFIPDHKPLAKIWGPKVEIDPCDSYEPCEGASGNHIIAGRRLWSPCQ